MTLPFDRPLSRASLLVSVALGLWACADGKPAAECHFQADCADGQICVNAACQAACDATHPCAAGERCEAAGYCAADTDGGTGGSDATVPGTCTGDNDGRISRAEFPLAPGVGAPFLSTGIEAVFQADLTGTDAAGGLKTWDLHTLPAGVTGTSRFSALFSPADTPAAAAFPNADYVAPLNGSPGLVAFFDLTATELHLLGVADVGGTFTKMVYDPPVTVLRFPFGAGDAWDTVTTSSGAFLGASVSVSETWHTAVAAAGTVSLPLGDVPALELVTQVDRDYGPAGFTRTETSLDFVSECGGFVARAALPEGATGVGNTVRYLELLQPMHCSADSDCGTGGACGATSFCEGHGTLGDALGNPTPICTPNGDGQIGDDEMPMRAGLSGIFRLNDPARTVTVDLAPHDVAGVPTWDFRADTLGTDDTRETALDPGGFWFSNQFVDATYVATLDAATGTMAVFRRQPGVLLLLGLASKTPQDTLLIYDEPVPAMKFPLKPGDHWTAQTSAHGLLGGSQATLVLNYTFTAQPAGQVQLPAGTIPVIPLLIEGTQGVEGAPFVIGRKTYLFLAECLGGVVRVVSGVNEESLTFTTATDVSRLTVPRCLSSLDCDADHVCDDGLCLRPNGDPDPDAGVPHDDATVPPTDGGVPPPDSTHPEPDANVPLCDPRGDGVVERADFPLRAGLVATFRIASSDGGFPVDLHGSPCAQGTCWNLAGPQDGDVDTVTELQPVVGTWFEADFPDATYASVVDRDRNWLGVFRLTDGALQLLGTASAQPSEMETHYDPPVDLYRFPLHAGDHWTVETSQSGYWSLSPITTSDTYTIEVAAHGQVSTPQGDFGALQVIARVAQQVPFTIFGSNTVVHTFVSECFGIVGRVVSLDGETEPYFDRAGRIERLAPAN